MELKKTDEFVEVTEQGNLVTKYYYSEKYARPFFYPVVGPYGCKVTRSYPIVNVNGETTDHPHHKSVWTAYGDINGIDDWSEQGDYGKIIHKKFIKLEAGKFVHIISRNEWVAKDEKKLMTEEREIKIHTLDTDEKIFDFVIIFKATESDIKFGDTKEGGIISVRVATSMDGDKGGKIENANGGVGEKECWGKRAKWCDYSGSVEGKLVGIAIFDHPNNLRHPTYWHVRDYGLFAANPFGISSFENNTDKKGDFILEKNKELKFKYRIFVHKGNEKESNLEQKYQEFLANKL